MNLKNKNKLVAWALVALIIFFFCYTILNISIFNRPL